MASTISKLYITLYFTFFFSSTLAVNSSSTTDLNSNLSSVRNFCRSTPYPDACFDSLKLSISINISPNILNYLLQTLDTALSEAGKLTNVFSSVGKANDIIEKQRGTMRKGLHEITLSSLKKSVSRIKSGDSKQLPDARSYLSAALTNKNTCLEVLDSASGSFKPVLVNSLGNIYKHSGDDEYDPSEVITVAADGTGNFSIINDAISFAPNNSYDRVIIYVNGVYEENVEIPSYKTNIVLLGDGNDATFITGNRIVVDGWTTFRSATLDNRVNWTGYHVMEIEDAYNFTLSELITGEAWLDSTGFPYDAGI
ncbi:putative pectinesterase/pectinesterase inhibitor 12 [Hibiscus syriacus]|uniref:Pectinesterase/pectinesterase inhibitor 12 n=1 Tax=Hibiscus syriacus TaxID=106335 RepID=A0A6A2WGH2_HIBSY|nr:putative pectinesterase/pectinesterase inhibitor 12 [Hibiscus syriacus]